jgi:acyl carrier protein
MSSEDPVLDRLNEVFRDVFDDDDLVVEWSTSAADIEGWDSLMHVTLLLKIEKAFGVRFSSSEIAKFQNVGELADFLDDRLCRRQA